MPNLPPPNDIGNSGSHQEFEKFLSIYKGTICIKIKTEVRDYHYQEDLFQEVSWRLFHGNIVARIKSGEIQNPLSYIKEITENVIKDFHRQKENNRNLKFVGDLIELEGRYDHPISTDDGESYMRYLTGLGCIQDMEGLYPVSEALILHCEKDHNEGESFKTLRIPSSQYYRVKDRVRQNCAFRYIFQDRV